MIVPTRPPGRDLVVLQSSPAPRPTTNPYIVMLGRALAQAPGVRPLHFSWRTALLGRYDVFHVHWPEILVDGRSPLKKAVRQALTVALVAKLTLGRIPIVRTVHNLERPQGIGRRESLLLALMERMTTLRVRVNPITEIPADQPHATILHGHYRDWFRDEPRADAVPGRLGYVGLVRRYKGVEQLVARSGARATRVPTCRCASAATRPPRSWPARSARSPRATTGSASTSASSPTPSSSTSSPRPSSSCCRTGSCTTPAARSRPSRSTGRCSCPTTP